MIKRNQIRSQLNDLSYHLYGWYCYGVVQCDVYTELGYLVFNQTPACFFNLVRYA